MFIQVNEIDKDVKNIYQENFGNTPFGDITKIDEKTIPDHDILCAGFPCQAFSISGKQQGFQDNRGTLFFDILRIVNAKKPKIIFLENVKNFATHNNGKTLELVKNKIEELGYKFYLKILNAVDFGIPQKRERIYIVCFRNDLNIDNFTFPKSFKLTKYLENFLIQNESELENLYVNRSDIFLNNNIIDDKNSNRPIRLGSVNKGGQGERIYSPKGVAITLSAYGGGIFSKTGGYLIKGKLRKLHPRECARIMGFPDTYKISKNKNQAYKQFGNSVVVDVLQYIALKIGTKLRREDKK